MEHHGDEEDAQRSERTSCSSLVGANSTSKPLPKHPPACTFVSPPGGLFGRVVQPDSPSSAPLPQTRLSHERETSTGRASFSPSSAKVLTLAQATAREIRKASSSRLIAQSAALRLSGALSLDDMQVRHQPEALRRPGQEALPSSPLPSPPPPVRAVPVTKRVCVGLPRGSTPTWRTPSRGPCPRRRPCPRSASTSSCRSRRDPAPTRRVTGAQPGATRREARQARDSPRHASPRRARAPSGLPRLSSRRIRSTR